MLNKIFIMGRLTRDPELRRTQSGTPVTSLSLWPWTGTSSPSPARRRRISSTWSRGVSTAEFVSQLLHQGPHGRGGGPAADPRLDRTGTATNAAARRLWPTTSISATASATALPRGDYAAVSDGAAAMAALRSTARPLAAMPPPWPLRSVTLPRSTRRTATCRSDVHRHNIL